LDFVEQMSNLSLARCAALAAAPTGNGSANQAIALIETRFAVKSAYGHCKSERFGSWGNAIGLKRYKSAPVARSRRPHVRGRPAAGLLDCRGRPSRAEQSDVRRGVPGGENAVLEPQIDCALVDAADLAAQLDGGNVDIAAHPIVHLRRLVLGAYYFALSPAIASSSPMAWISVFSRNRSLPG
jgi:hypothetical protein